MSKEEKSQDFLEERRRFLKKLLRGAVFTSALISTFVIRQTSSIAGSSCNCCNP